MNKNGGFFWEAVGFVIFMVLIFFLAKLGLLNDIAQWVKGWFVK